MSDYRYDYRTYRNLADPFDHDSGFNARLRPGNAPWRWIVAALLLVITAAAFGVGHRSGQAPTQMVSNIMMPPAPGSMAPTAAASPAVTPVPTRRTPPPIVPGLQAPAPSDGAQ